MGMGDITTTLNPYLLYIKIAGAVAVAVAVIGVLVWFGWNEANIRADQKVEKIRSELKTEQDKRKLSDATVQMYAKAFNDNKQLQEDIVNAIRSIKVQSNNYIKTIETSHPPAFTGTGDVVMLIPPGLPTAPAAGMPGDKSVTPGGDGAITPGS